MLTLIKLIFRSKNTIEISAVTLLSEDIKLWSDNKVANNPYCIDIQEWSAKIWPSYQFIQFSFFWYAEEGSDQNFQIFWETNSQTEIDKKEDKLPMETILFRSVHMKNKKHSLQLIPSLVVVYDHFSKTAKLLSFCAADNRVLSPVLRIHNRFGGMRDLAIFYGDTRDAS